MPTTYPTNTLVQRSTTQSAGPSVASLTKTIPFDYVFEFKLKGKDPSSQDVVKLQDVVEISMQGIFVAVSLGYSFVLDESKVPREPLAIKEEPGPVIVAVPAPLGTVSVPPFTAGIAGKPNSRVTLLNISGSATERFVFGEETFELRDVTRSLQDGEQDVITLNDNGVAQFDVPTEGHPGSLCVWDRNSNVVGQPLQRAAVGPNPEKGSMPNVGDEIIYIYGTPDETATVLLLEARTGNSFQVKNENGELNFKFNTQGWASVRLLVAPSSESSPAQRKLSRGDLLIITPTSFRDLSPSTFAIPSRRVADLSVGEILKGFNDARATAVRPTARFANIVRANPQIADLSRSALENAFEPAAGPEDVSFLYSIDIVSSGRELQNKPIHNIAGLGIANGDRPFRPFARPIAFEPRSVIRIQIEELSTLPGTLYIVLQGYKTLGTGRRPE